MNQAVQERVVFSTLYNESDGFLTTYVENVLRHTGPDAILVVNLPPGREIACPVAEHSDRVLVITGALPRRKFGHTLLNGHLEAFEAALGHFGPFGYFCPLASNSLFARRFDPVAAQMALARSGHVTGVDLNDLPDTWYWPMLARSPDLIPFLRDTWGLTRVGNNQIEGLFAAASDWGLLHARRAEIIALGATMRPDGEFPMEEIVPATILCTFGSGRYVHLCHMFWDRPPTDNVRLDDVMGIGERFPDHVCLLKWFERSPANLITAAADAAGLISALGAPHRVQPDAGREPPDHRAAGRTPCTGRPAARLPVHGTDRDPPAAAARRGGRGPDRRYAVIRARRIPGRRRRTGRDRAAGLPLPGLLPGAGRPDLPPPRPVRPG